MAAKKPLVITNGQIEQLQVGDTLDAVVNEVDITTQTNANAGAIVIGQPVYIASAGNVDLARANAQGTVQALGLVIDTSVSSSQPANIITDGVLVATTGQWDAVTGGSGGLTAGAVYYLAAGSAGALTATAPTTPGNFVVRIGKAISTTEMEISIEPPIKL